MCKIAIITSLDYELFGDGTGSVSREQIIPTQHLMNIASLYGVKLTILFEYGQYCAYEKHKQFNKLFNEENRKIEKQLVDFIKNGHDVQLHYHAQWFNAKFDCEIETFNLNLDLVDFTSLPFETMKELLLEGKDFLENLLKPINPNYKCIGFRSGSWAVKDEEKLFKALVSSGFKADSSVVPNTKFESEQVNFEYSDCPHNYKFWFVDKKISKKSVRDKEFIEIPPFTNKNRFAFLKYINPKNKLSRLIMSKFYKTKISEKNFSLFQKIRKVLTRDYYMADINTMSYKTLEKMVEQVYNENKDYDGIIPLMFIGHPKVTYGSDDLHLLYLSLKEKYDNKIEYWTYQETIEFLINRKEDIL